MSTPDENVSPGADAVWYSPTQLEEIVRAFMAKEQVAHQTEIAQLRAQVDALGKSMSGNVPTLIPEHGAGAGLAVHPTWSKYEQERQHAAREMAALAAAATVQESVTLPHIEGLS